MTISFPRVIPCAHGAYSEGMPDCSNMSRPPGGCRDCRRHNFVESPFLESRPEEGALDGRNSGRQSPDTSSLAPFSPRVSSHSAPDAHRRARRYVVSSGRAFMPFPETTYVYGHV